MKKLLLSLSLLFIFGSVFSQSIPNGNFENWGSTSWDELTGAQSSASRGLIVSGLANTSKTTDKVSGNYAIKLETQIVGNDTVFGYFIFGKADDNGLAGGFPYTQKPTVLTGSYKYNIQTGDSAMLLVYFKNSGTYVGGGSVKITGSQNTYTTFSLSLSVPISPDSVIVAATSSLPEGFYVTPTAINGSWIQFDNLSFGGPGITQQMPNLDFENWTTIQVENPSSWNMDKFNIYSYLQSGSQYISKSTDFYKGSYAAKITSYIIDTNDYFTFITNGDIMTGRPKYPFTNQYDSLIFHYKYTAVGTDTASYMVQCTNNGNYVGFSGGPLFPTSTYTRVSVPINCSMTPDSMLVGFMSSRNNPTLSNNGSTLIIDEVHVKSQPLQTSIEKYNGWANTHVFPNPAHNYTTINIDLKESVNVNMSISDISGKVLFTKENNPMHMGKNIIYINTTDFAKGIYFFTIKANDGASIASGKIVVE